MMKKNKLKRQFGFSILEVIIAILIISIGMIGVLSLITQNIQVQYIGKNDLIASQLAQEGLELVRNIRDTNWLTAGNDWKTGAGATTNSDIVQDGDYAIDYSGAIIDINSIDNAGLNIDAAGFYTHNAGAATAFYRLITVVDNADYLDVECKVRWKERGRTHDYAVKTLLYNWY
ncbi:MAG: prepilin-type N-terminal cleavage/methylation domain-containing protein [bacterium]|nr:prepilin-type N-terminal cleavage/methylation domain-containing protein [bacterium]